MSQSATYYKNVFRRHFLPDIKGTAFVSNDVWYVVGGIYNKDDGAIRFYAQIDETTGTAIPACEDDGLSDIVAIAAYTLSSASTQSQSWQELLGTFEPFLRKHANARTINL